MCFCLTLQFVLGPFDLDKMGVDLLLQLLHLSSQPADLAFLRTQSAATISEDSTANGSLAEPRYLLNNYS